jgi:orotidine-5'-phosphate decarboxylase
MLEAASKAAESQLALVGVTILTSHDAAEAERIFGRGIPDLGLESERLARLALRAGMRGVVASGHELGLLRESLGGEAWIVVPGIRFPGDPVADQARSIAPAEAVRRGATHLVVGRSITGARDPVSAYRRLLEALD